MNDSATKQAHWAALLEHLDHWFHQPDPLTIRATMAVAAAVSMDVPPTWLMLIGPPSCGKTEMHFPQLRGCKHHVEETSDVNVPGLMSLERHHKGTGLLARIGVRGLWLIKDFSSIIGMHEEQRNALMAAMREIYDGKWQRHKGLGGDSWTGRVNVIAAATPAIEAAHRVTADLGDRFIGIRVTRPNGPLWRKAALQRDGRPKMRNDLETAGRTLLGAVNGVPEASDEWLERIWAGAEVVALCRTPITRHYKSNQIMDVGSTEGPTRVFQEILAILQADAALQGHETVGEAQLPLLLRLTFDTIPLHRGNIIRTLPLNTAIRRTDLIELAGEKWDDTFERTTDELLAIGAAIHRNEGNNSMYEPSVFIRTQLRTLHGKTSVDF